MGRNKNGLDIKAPFVLRYRNLADGRKSIQLDFMHAGKHDRESLSLYLLPEDSTSARRENAKTMRMANDILQSRIRQWIEDKAEMQNPRKGKAPSILEWMTICRNTHMARGLKDIDGIHHTIKILTLFGRNVSITEIDREYCLDLIDFMRNEYRTARGQILTEKTANNYLGHFRTALNEAMRKGLIDRNPYMLLDRSERIKVPASKREYLTIDEIERLIETPLRNMTIKKAFLFSVFTSLRLGDIIELRWKDIFRDGDRLRLCIRQQKTDHPVLMPLSRQAERWLPERSYASPDDHVFDLTCTRTNIEKSVRRWAGQAGIEKHISFHVSRHTVGTTMRTLSADLYTVSKLMGHRSIASTQIYAKIVNQKKDDAVNLTDGVFD